MDWYALMATPVCLLNSIFLPLFIFARQKHGQTFNLFNSIYQSISDNLNRKVNENTLDTESFVESAAKTTTTTITKAAQSHTHAENI